MRIALQTYGTKGDVLPFITLGGALIRAGHTVTLAATCIDGHDYSKVCQQNGISFIPVPDMIDIPSCKLQHIGMSTNPLRSMIETLNVTLVPFIDPISDIAEMLCSTHACIVSHFGLFPCRAAAIKANIPQISLTFWPGFLISLAEQHRASAAWVAMKHAIDAIIKPSMNSVWKRFGLAPPESALHHAFFSDILNLVAVSPLLSNHNIESDSIHKICGYFPFKETGRIQSLPEDVVSFITEGEKPLFMSFGSLHRIYPQQCLDLFMEAARLYNGKVIIQIRGSEIVVDKNILVIGDYPHDYLLKYCKAAVIHGGAGTSHAVIAAGVPSLTIAFNEEQYGWGMSIYKKGLGVSPLHFRDISAAQIVSKIKEIADSREMQTSVKTASEQLAQESGTENAVSLIGQALARFNDQRVQ
jgi:UDP:flavonoid glycosyltransferase YjiC (YdhE family)